MMKTIRRWTSSIVSSFDWMISQVENHDAVVNSALKEIQESGARAKVQLTRVGQDGEKIRKRLVDMRESAELWKGRALKSAKLDEKRALECLKRKKRLEVAIAELEGQERTHAKLERQLAEDLILIDEKILGLKQQRNILRTRQSRAEAFRALQGQDSHMISELDDIFDRWETKVTQYELQGNLISSEDDDFENEFASEEEESELRNQLKDLINDDPVREKELPNATD